MAMTQIRLHKLLTFWLTALLPVTVTMILIILFRTFISVYIFEPYFIVLETKCFLTQKGTQPLNCVLSCNGLWDLGLW